MKYLVVNGMFTDECVINRMKELLNQTCEPDAVHIFNWPAYTAIQYMDEFMRLRYWGQHGRLAVCKLYDTVVETMGNSDANLTIVCHSFGSVITKRCIELLSRERRARIIIHAMGPAEYVPCDTGVAAAINFVYKQDIISRVLCMQTKKTRQRKRYNVIMVSEKYKNPLNIHSNHVDYTDIMVEYESLPFVDTPHRRRRSSCSSWWTTKGGSRFFPAGFCFRWADGLLF